MKTMKMKMTVALILIVSSVFGQYSLKPYYKNKYSYLSNHPLQVAACGDTVFYTASGSGATKIYKTAGSSLDSIRYKFYNSSASVISITSESDTLFVAYTDGSQYRRTYKFYHSKVIDSNVVWTHNSSEQVWSVTTDSLHNIYEIIGYTKDSILVLNSSFNITLEKSITWGTPFGNYGESTIHNGNLYFNYHRFVDTVYERSGPMNFGTLTKLFQGKVPYYGNDTLYYTTIVGDSLCFLSNYVQDTNIVWITSSSSGVFVGDKYGIKKLFNPHPALHASLTSHSNVTCFGSCNGDATVTPSAGTPPYTYSWTSGGTNASASNLCAGTYTCTVTDAYVNDTVKIVVTITEPAQLRDSIVTSTDNGCFGGNDGSATVGVKGGTLPYTYAWTGNVSTTASATSLAAGSYTITVSDANGCSESASVTITQPTQIVITTSTSDDTAAASVTGGTAPYTYAWTPTGGTKDTATGLTNGTYTVTVKDANGCQATASVTVIVSGVQDISNANERITVYPNPTSGVINVTIDKKAIAIVYDVTGQVLYSDTLESGTHAISIDAQSGVYFIRVGSAVQKIVKK